MDMDEKNGIIGGDYCIVPIGDAYNEKKPQLTLGDYSNNAVLENTAFNFTTDNGRNNPEYRIHRILLCSS